MHLKFCQLLFLIYSGVVLIPHSHCHALLGTNKHTKTGVGPPHSSYALTCWTVPPPSSKFREALWTLRVLLRTQESKKISQTPTHLGGRSSATILDICKGTAERTQGLHTFQWLIVGSLLDAA